MEHPRAREVLGTALRASGWDAAILVDNSRTSFHLISKNVFSCFTMYVPSINEVNDVQPVDLTLPTVETMSGVLDRDRLGSKY